MTRPCLCSSTGIIYKPLDWNSTRLSWTRFENLYDMISVYKSILNSRTSQTRWSSSHGGQSAIKRRGGENWSANLHMTHVREDLKILRTTPLLVQVHFCMGTGVQVLFFKFCCFGGPSHVLLYEYFNYFFQKKKREKSTQNTSGKRFVWQI